MLSGDGAGPAFDVGLLGVDDMTGSNRGNYKKSHCSCHGGGTSPAFIVGLLDVDSKRGGNRGCHRPWYWREIHPDYGASR